MLLCYSIPSCYNKICMVTWKLFLSHESLAIMIKVLSDTWWSDSQFKTSWSFKEKPLSFIIWLWLQGKGGKVRGVIWWLRIMKRAVGGGGILANTGGSRGTDVQVGDFLTKSSLECQPQTTNRYFPSLRDKLELWRRKVTKELWMQLLLVLWTMFHLHPPSRKASSATNSYYSKMDPPARLYRD